MMRRTFISLALLAATGFAASWMDRAEYDLVLNLRAEAVPQKQVALLNEWKAKYPNSELRQFRRELYLSAYLSMGDQANLLEVGRDMLREDPNNLVGAYWLTVLTPA